MGIAGKGPRLASEVIAEQAADPEYLRVRREADAKRARIEAEDAAASLPILDDLASVGHPVTSVWDFVNTSEPYYAALPVLMKHFERGGYPPKVMEGLGRALAVKPSHVYWDRLRVRWLEARDPGEEDGAAVALAACATRDDVDDLLWFLTLDNKGDSRIYFIRKILRLGGARGYWAVDALRDHPVFGKEATALIRRRKPPAVS